MVVKDRLLSASHADATKGWIDRVNANRKVLTAWCLVALVVAVFCGERIVVGSAEQASTILIRTLFDVISNHVLEGGGHGGGEDWSWGGAGSWRWHSAWTTFNRHGDFQLERASRNQHDVERAFGLKGARETDFVRVGTNCKEIGLIT